jgi:hypothetical protein
MTRAVGTPAMPDGFAGIPVLTKIAPFRVVLLYERFLLGPKPALDFLFLGYRFYDLVGLCIPYEFRNIVAAGETPCIHLQFVFVYSTLEVTARGYS